jgi:hypothetical protein
VPTCDQGSSFALFEGSPVAMMVAMTLMHHYHVGGYSGPNEDPLKPLLSVFKVDAKTIAKAIKSDVDAKIVAIEASLKKRRVTTSGTTT